MYVFIIAVVSLATAFSMISYLLGKLDERRELLADRNHQLMEKAEMRLIHKEEKFYGNFFNREDESYGSLSQSRV